MTLHEPATKRTAASDLPSASKYERSYMHRDTVTHCSVVRKSDTIITASSDGVVKFWKKGSANGELALLRQYKAHAGHIHNLAVSHDGLWLATSGGDKSVKFFDILNYDMVHFAKLDFVPTGLEWAYTVEEKPRLLVIEHDVVHMHDFDGCRARVRVLADKVVTSEEPADLEAKPMLKYSHASNVVLTIRKGSILFWSLDAPSYTLSVQELKEEFDVVGFEWSADFAQFALACADRQIRLFRANGKMLKRFDESLAFYADAFERGRFYPSFLGRSCEQSDFDRRMNLEREAMDWNCIFDESGEHILWASPIGIKVVSLQSNRLVQVIGFGEGSLRFTRIALFQGGKGPVALEMVASGNPLAEKALAIDPAIIALAHRRPRLFVLTQREPRGGGERDVVNERPEAARRPQREERRLVLDPAAQVVHAIIRTDMGDIVVELYPKDAPLACDNFVQLAQRGYYNNVIFHRVIRNFMIQSGDPTGTGTGGESIWGEPFKDEFSLKHDQPLVLSMANSGPNTNGAQFFITTVKCAWLDGKHTVFGRVTKGGDVVHRIEHVEVRRDRPVEPPKIVQIDFPPPQQQQ